MARPARSNQNNTPTRPEPPAYHLACSVQISSYASFTSADEVRKVSGLLTTVS